MFDLPHGFMWGESRRDMHVSTSDRTVRTPILAVLFVFVCFIGSIIDQEEPCSQMLQGFS